MRRGEKRRGEEREGERREEREKRREKREERGEKCRDYISRKGHQARCCLLQTPSSA